MHVLDQIRLVVYRCHETGLEIFLVNTDFDDTWRIPFEKIAKYNEDELQKLVIDLGPVEAEDGTMVQTYAIEGDYHDIPSIRKLVKGDFDIVTSKVKYIMTKGAFFAIKETFKKVLPNEYNALHELKEILSARNLLSNI
jgi:DNA polymerase III epsilon subunit-like protein